MKLCQHKLTLAYFVYHQVYFLLKDQRASATIISAFSRTPARAHTHPHTLTYTHTHPHTPTHTPTTLFPPSLHPHPQPPNLPPPTPSSSTSPPPHIILHYLPAMNTKSMDVLLIQRVRGISRGIGRKPTAGTEISRSAAPKAGRVTTTRALGFGCHSVSQRSLHVQPKGRITYEDGGNPNTGTHEMKTHTHRDPPQHLRHTSYDVCC